MTTNEYYKLNNGIEMPKTGLGTWFIKNSDAAEVVRQAVKCGYRLIDTAQAYMNEAGVGEGIRTCGVKRDELFVIDKIAAEAKSYDDAKKSIDDILSKTGLDYLDQIIIHAPQPWRKWRDKKNRYFAENKEVWRALEEANQAGKVRSIGVANFLQDDLENLLEGCAIRPAVNQILCHISNTPTELIGFCQKNDILVEAYSPVAHGKVLKNETIVEMAARYGISAAQLCLCYDLQLGTLPLPKTTNPLHMAENLKLDFEISTADMETLKQVPQIKSYGFLMNFMPVFSGK